MTFSQTYLERIETSNTKRQVTPDYQLNNPLDKELFVSGIVLVPDSYFQLKGKAVIQVNGVTVFDEADSETFKDVSELPIALTQKILGRAQKIEAWLWNGIDNDKVALTINVKLSENQDETFASIKSIDSKTQKDNVSLQETLFDYRIYRNETVTKLLNMRGYKNLIVMFASSEIPPIIINPDFQNSSQKNVVITIVISGTSLTASFNPASDTYQTEAVYDLNNESTKEIMLTVENYPDTQFTNWNGIQVSDGTGGGYYVYNPIARYSRTPKWTVIEDNDPNFSNPNIILNEVPNLPANLPITTTKRYMKIIQHLTIGFIFIAGSRTHQNGSFPIGGCTGCGVYDRNYTVSKISITNPYDQLSTGGIASLSFEILNTANNTWNEYIASSEFGTVSAGQKITKQIGDVVGKKLPSHQSRFRGKLTITNGGIQTGVSVERVS